MPVVRFIDAAIDDLRALNKKDPQILGQIFKKLALLEISADAGQPLAGPLSGYRKLTVGNRTWRIIWRLFKESNGQMVIEIAEVWAIGARSDDEIYKEMKRRLSKAKRSPATKSLEQVIEILDRSRKKQE
jgi:mRNA interferase RelE/StbE